MGISIQQYRACIGSFLSSRISHSKSSGNKSTKPSNHQSTNIYNLKLLVFIFFLMINISCYQNFSKTSSTSETFSSSPRFIKTSSTLEFFGYSPRSRYYTLKTPGVDLPAIVPNNLNKDPNVKLLAPLPLIPGLDNCSMINGLSSFIFTAVSNFQSRYVNGNRSSKGIKIGHWNKGNSHLVNKMAEIKNIIGSHHPHILGVSEANLHGDHDQSLAAITDYNLHVCPTITNPSMSMSRVVVYTHKDIVAKARPDLMCETYSSIWLEVGLPNHKKFLVNQSYREWQQRGNKSSNSIPEQLTRWLKFLDQWERALATGMEVHCVGDMNLNHCNWTDPNLPRTNQSYKLRELTSALFTKIMPHGVSQLVSGPTRHFPGQVSTGLDHYYTNRPDKLAAVQTHHCGGSDHMLITAVRHSKSFKTSPRYIRKRTYKNFDLISSSEQSNEMAGHLPVLQCRSSC